VYHLVLLFGVASLVSLSQWRS